MLEMMRSHKFFSVFLLSLITFIIIISFVFWGIGPHDNPSTGIVAQVGKEKITLDDYWRVYDNTYRFYKRMYPNEEEIKKLNLKDSVLYELIENTVLKIAADEIGIRVTEDEFLKAIVSEPAFQRDGVFDRDVYTRALKLQRLSPQTFENAMMTELLILKMRRLIGEVVELNDEEEKMLEGIKGDKAQLTEVLLSAKRNTALKAYVQGLKRQMKITINRDRIS